MRPCPSPRGQALGLFLGLTLLLPAPAFSQESKKRPVPPEDARAKVAKLIDELYQDELAKSAKDGRAKARLAQTLLQEGRDTADDAAGRYVLFRRAHQLAAEAGDVGTALQAAEELAQDFAIAPAELFKLKVDTLATAASATKAPAEAYQTVVDSSLLLLDDTLAADDFAASMALLKAADAAAIRLRNVPLVSSIRKRTAEVAALQKEYARWAPFAAQLDKNPDDPKAGYEMGFYYALIKGNWQKGLPLMARGNGELTKIAGAEKSAAAPADVVSAAEAWFTFAKSAKEPARVHALQHAAELYLRAMNDSGTADRSKVEKRLEEVNEALPPEYRAGELTGELRKIDLPSGPVYDAALSPDGTKVLATSYDGSLRLLDAKSGKELRRLDGHVGKVWTVAFASDGRRAVSGGFDGSVRLWDLTSARELRRFPGHNGYVRSVALSADGLRVLSGGDDRMLRLWDVETAKEVRAFAGHDHFVWGVALSRDGKHALSAGLDKTVRLWDVEGGKELKALIGHGDTVLAVAFSPDGRRALSGSSDKTLKLWDLSSGTAQATFSGHTGYVHSVAFSPDGRRAISAGSDNTVRLWDAATGKQLRTLGGHRDQVWSVAFSRDGRLAVSTGQDATVRLWGGSR